MFFRKEKKYYTDGKYVVYGRESRGNVKGMLIMKDAREYKFEIGNKVSGPLGDGDGEFREIDETTLDMLKKMENFKHSK